MFKRSTLPIQLLLRFSLSLLVLAGFQPDLFPQDVPKVTFNKVSDGDIRIFVDNAFFAEYRDNFRGTPIIWPICAPNNSLATRAWPMIDDVEVSEEPDANMQVVYKNAIISERKGSKDHPHHRSLWFNHGDVNQGDFWTLSASVITPVKSLDVSLKDNRVVVLAENQWIHGKLQRALCKDMRNITFGVLEDLPDVRFIDFDVTITALENNVTFGDTKEGSFGVRLPSPTAVTSKSKNKTWGGHIINREGDKDAQVWSKKSGWVNYVGPAESFLVGDELETELSKGNDSDDFPLTTIGIAILNGSNSLNSIPWSHVRDYGLMAINPFGQRDFEPHNPKANGAQKLNKDESLHFSFRILIHNGSLTSEEIEKAYNNFLEGK